jgi:hypothetical protein
MVVRQQQVEKNNVRLKTSREVDCDRGIDCVIDVVAHRIEQHHERTHVIEVVIDDENRAARHRLRPYQI